MSTPNPTWELLDLVTGRRPDWGRPALEGAVTAALTNGWSWDRVARTVVGLMSDPRSQPRDLVAAVRWGTGHGDRDVNAWGAALAREAIAKRGAA